MITRNTALFLTTCITAFVSFALARDPNYAANVRIEEENRGVDHQFRMVSLNWLDYFTRSTDNPLQLYYTIQSLPEELVVRDGRTGAAKFYRRNDENEKKAMVRSVFEHVIKAYSRHLLLLKKPMEVHIDSVDPTGVLVNNGRNWFNRTIVITFEDPPYGQSRPNRLVTNRNIPWTVWGNIDNDLVRYRQRTNQFYNQTEDLIYRYFHNLGHSLGFGHYLGSTKNGVDTPYRSVMYPNYNDLRYSASSPFRNKIDRYVMSQLANDYDKYLMESAKNVSLKLSDSLNKLLLVSVAMV